jgi:hypothetical protein
MAVAAIVIDRNASVSRMKLRVRTTAITIGSQPVLTAKASRASAGWPPT